MIKPNPYSSRDDRKWKWLAFYRIVALLGAAWGDLLWLVRNCRHRNKMQMAESSGDSRLEENNPTKMTTVSSGLEAKRWSAVTITVGKDTEEGKEISDCSCSQWWTPNFLYQKSMVGAKQLRQNVLPLPAYIEASCHAYMLPNAHESLSLLGSGVVPSPNPQTNSEICVIFCRQFLRKWPVPSISQASPSIPEHLGAGSRRQAFKLIKVKRGGLWYKTTKRKQMSRVGTRRREEISRKQGDEYSQNNCTALMTRLSSAYQLHHRL